MSKHHKKDRRGNKPKRQPFWVAVRRWGFGNALRYELKHPRRYPGYPIWFIPMIVSIVILAIILFNYTIDNLPILFYILEIIVVGYMMFRLLKRLHRIRIKGDLLRLWGLRILSGLITAFGFVIIYFNLVMFMLVPVESLLNEGTLITDIVTFGHQWNTPFIVPLALEVIGLGLLLIGAFLLFKFKIKSGNIIWVGRIGRL